MRLPKKAGQALSDTITAKEDALKAIGDKQTTATQAVDTARDKALQQVKAATEAAQTAANEAATSAGNADRSAQKAAGSLKELKDGIASGDFKGEPGTSPTIAVQDITGGHRIVITDATGTSFVDVLNGKQGDPGKPGNTGATPELTIGTVEEGDAPSATITGTAKNPVLNLTLKSGAPGKDATVDATLSQSGKAADAKVTGDALATKAVIDDTTVGTDAWSSKHIVDMLCPPLEETGNPVVCYPVASYPLGVTAGWEPTQEGSGEPSPENVRPIKGRDSVTVKVTGKNLVDVDTAFAMTGEALTISNGHIKGTTSNGSARIGYLLQNALAARYIASVAGGAKDVSTEIRVYIWENGKFGNLVAQKTYQYRNGKVITIAFSADGKSDYAVWFRPNAAVDFDFYDVQLELGSTATVYSPYTGQTATLTLPATIYGGTVDAVTGESGENVKIIVVDGDDIKFASASSNRYWNLPMRSALGASGVLESSHFGSGTFSLNEKHEFIFTQPTVMQGLFSSVDELNAYCAAQYAVGTPVQIAYKLATPTPFTATGAQPIPALSGVNTVLTDADSVAVTGRADPIKRITDLEDAVASMTTT